MNIWLRIIFLSMAPIGELRGSIPYALSQGINPYTTFFIAVVANSLIVLPTLFFMDYFHKHLMKIDTYKKIFNYYIKRIMKKIEASKYQWEYLMLFMFVAIPLPCTGAYTGSLVTWLCKMERKKAMATIYVAVVTAAIIVTLISLGAIFGYSNLI